MRRRDLISPSPTERAEVLYKHLQQIKPTIWDMVCFAGELLTVACEELPALQPAVKEIISSIYTAHYNVNEPFASSVRPKHVNQQDGGSVKPAHGDTRPALTLMRQSDERNESESSDASGNDDQSTGDTSE